MSSESLSDHPNTLISESPSIPIVLEEIQAGYGISLAAAARITPAGNVGASANPSTLFRWCTNGAKSVSGQRIKLEHVRIGSRIMTTKTALQRFILALSEIGEVPVTRTSFQKQQAAKRADRELRDMGC